MLKKLMETDRRKKSDGEATAIVKMFADLQPVLLFILTLVFSIILLASCKKDDVIQTNTNTNPLVGEWYEVGSTENRGTKVTFTETTVTAYPYDDRYPEDMWQRWYDNVDYSIISKNEIKLSGLPDKTWSMDDGTHITEFTLDNDTLIIDHFIQYFIHVLYPLNMGGIALIRE